MSNMNSTSHLRKDMYQGPVKEFTSLMVVFAYTCFILTMVAAARFYRLSKSNSELSSFRYTTFHKTIVAALCFLEMFHALSTSILNQTAPTDLTCKSTNPAPWGMKLVFLTTAAVTFICQSYIAHLIYQLYGRMKWFFTFTMICVVLAFVQGIGSSLFGQAMLDHTLGAYLSWVTTTSCTVLVADYAALLAISFYDWKKRQLPRDSGKSRAFNLLAGSIAGCGLIIQIPNLVFSVSDGIPSVLWAFVELAGYELVGNLHPYIIVTLMCTPNFARWDKEEDNAKVSLLQFA